LKIIAQNLPPLKVAYIAVVTGARHKIFHDTNAMELHNRALPQVLIWLR